MTSAVSQLFQQVVLAIEHLPTLATCGCGLVLVLRLHVAYQASLVKIEPTTYSAVRHCFLKKKRSACVRACVQWWGIYSDGSRMRIRISVKWQ